MGRVRGVKRIYLPSLILHPQQINQRREIKICYDGGQVLLRLAQLVLYSPAGKMGSLDITNTSVWGLEIPHMRCKQPTLDLKLQGE